MGQPQQTLRQPLGWGTAGGASVPEYTVDPGNVVALEGRLSADCIIIIDFGAAFYHDERPLVIYTPAPFSAPEIVFGGELTYAVDQWAPLGVPVIRALCGP